MPSSFFTREGDWFLPTDHCRGPWAEDACHAGPPTGLMARALEQTVSDKRLVRITVDLLRPIPFDGFRIDAQVDRDGRSVSTVTATLMARSGKPVVQARGMLLRERDLNGLPTVQDGLVNPEDCAPGQFPIREVLHDKPAFNGSGVEVRYPPSHDHAPGVTEAWLRTVPLLNDEDASPFQRLCPLADCGNAFGRNDEPQRVGFPNTDLSVVLHREPEGEWLGIRSRCFWQSSGVGMSDSTLFDVQGAVGHALQTLMLMPA